MKKYNSLTGRTLFREVLAKGAKIQDRYVRIYVLERNSRNIHKNNNDSFNVETTRIGITLNRHFGKSHERNRMRRRIKSFYRKLLPSIIGEYDIIVKPEKGFKYLPHCDEEDIITRMLVKAGAIKQQ